MNTIWENTVSDSFPTLFLLSFLCFICIWLGHAMREAERQDEQFRTYVQDATGGISTAGEMERLAQLRVQGAISDEECSQAKMLG